MSGMEKHKVIWRAGVQRLERDGAEGDLRVSINDFSTVLDLRQAKPSASWRASSG